MQCVLSHTAPEFLLQYPDTSEAKGPRTNTQFDAAFQPSVQIDSHPALWEHPSDACCPHIPSRKALRMSEANITKLLAKIEFCQTSSSLTFFLGIIYNIENAPSFRMDDLRKWFVFFFTGEKMPLHFLVLLHKKAHIFSIPQKLFY
jgi:hypothetical protein